MGVVQGYDVLKVQPNVVKDTVSQQVPAGFWMNTKVMSRPVMMKNSLLSLIFKVWSKSCNNLYC